MIKKRIKRFLYDTVLISFGTLIACIIWSGFHILSNGGNLLSGNVPYVMLTEIVILGLICGASTELLLGRVYDEETSITETRVRFVMHYICITLSVLVCGHLFDWYSVSFQNIFLMCLTSTAVYVFVYLSVKINGNITAEKMNEGLKRFNGQ